MHRAVFFFFNDTATTEIYTLSLHDALPISGGDPIDPTGGLRDVEARALRVLGGVSVGESSYGSDALRPLRDRKSTRLNSSHANISYAVFCLKKKKQNKKPDKYIYHAT